MHRLANETIKEFKYNTNNLILKVMNARDLSNLIIYHDFVFDGKNGSVLETIEIAKAHAIRRNLSLSQLLDWAANKILI